MKIYISYFYQIRNFPKTLIPLSTAHWDPKWYHKPGEDLFLDKNGVLNGLRIEELSPGKDCDGLCTGPDSCDTKDPSVCKFLKVYKEQIYKLDFKAFITSLNEFSQALQVIHELPYVDFALMVYEAPDNKCSERSVLKQWFSDNSLELEEFIPNR